MGPNDPFSSPPAGPARPPAERPNPPFSPGSPAVTGGASRRDIPTSPGPASPRTPATGAIVGLAVGLLFGVLVLTAGFGAALLVVFCGAIGAALGYLMFGLATSRLDVGAAWRALRGGP